MENFSTSDIALASTLLSLGYEIETIRNGLEGKKDFYFKEEKTLLKDVDEFWNRKLLIEPQSLFSNMRFLKSRIYHYER